MKAPDVVSTRAMALLTAICAAHFASAIPKLQYQELAHLGFGGRANSIDQNTVCGAVVTPQGPDSACAWQGAGFQAFTLNTVLAEGSEALDVSTNPASNLANIVGFADFPGGTRRGVLWRGATNGFDAGVPIPTNGTVGNTCVARVENTLPLQQLVVAFMCGNGIDSTTSFGELYVEHASGQIVPIQLPHLGGGFSRANDMILYNGHAGLGANVVGTSLNAQGKLRPCVWTVTENSSGTGWNAIITEIGMPAIQEEGEIQSVTQGRLGNTAAGTCRTANGIERGFVRSITDENVLFDWLYTRNPEGTVIKQIGDFGIHEFRSGLFVLGQAQGDTGAPVGTLGIVWEIERKGLQNNYRVKDVSGAGTPEIQTLRAVGSVYNASDWDFIGSAYTNDMEVQVPCLLESMREHYPDHLRLVAGGGTAGEQPEMNLWHDDNKKWVFFGSQAQQGLGLAESTILFLGDTGTHEVGHWVGVVAAHGQNASADVRVKALRPATNQFETIGTFVVGATDQTIMADFATADYVDPVNRSARFQVEFLPRNSTTRVYSIDQVSYTD